MFVRSVVTARTVLYRILVLREALQREIRCSLNAIRLYGPGSGARAPVSRHFRPAGKGGQERIDTFFAQRVG